MSKASKILNEFFHTWTEQNISEMSKEEIQFSAKEAVSYCETEMSKLFSKEDYTYSITYSDSRGGDFDIYFRNVSPNDHLLNRRNSSIDVIFVMTLYYQRDEKDSSFDKNLFQLEVIERKGFKKNKIVFKTIEGKTPLECAEKLMVWLKKNKDLIDSVPRFNEKPLGQ